MKTIRHLVVVGFLIALGADLLCQQTEEEIQTAVKVISPQVVRLSWPRVEPNSCGETITYSVYRDTTEDFDPSPKTQIASGITGLAYVAHEPKKNGDYYYRVVALRQPGYCPPPHLDSGVIHTFPLDLGREYHVTVGDKSEACRASSTAEIKCQALPDFHAVVATQGGHEFLIGCLTSDYEDGSWTCVNLIPGVYRIGVHSQSLVVWGAGFTKVNTKTGKGLGPITPEFSILSLLR